MDLSKLTPAPWFVTGFDVLNDDHDPPKEDSEVCVVDDNDLWILRMLQGREGTDDACFIALARNAFEGDPEALAWWEANRRKPA